MADQEPVDPQGGSGAKLPTEPGPEPRLRVRTTLWTTSSYFGEGLPWSFLHQMGTEYMTAIGAPLVQIGYTSWFHLAVTLKFLWSPFVDLFGSKRGWLIVMQVVLGLGMLAIAAIVREPGPGALESHALLLFWSGMSLFAILHATHDIACDGFYLLALDQREQALYSGIRVAAYRAAMWVGSGALVYLAGKSRWSLGFGAAGVLMLVVALVNAALLPRPERQQAAATTVTRRKTEFLAAYRTFLAQPQAVLVLTFMFFYRLGDIMMFAMSKPLLRDIGVDTAHRGILNTYGIPIFIAGSLLAGALIGRVGLARTLIPITYFQNLAILLYVLLAIARPAFPGVFAIIALEQLASGIGTSAHVVFLMQRCKRAFSASHYAFATAVVALASTVSGAMSGHLAKALGYPLFFTAAFVASWPSLVLVLFVPRRPLEPAAAQT